MAGTSWREIWQRIRQRFPKRIWGGCKEDDRLPASIETAIEVVCQPVDSFLSLLSFTPLHDWLLSVGELSTLQDLLGQQKAYIFLLLLPTISSHASLKIFFSHIYTNSSYLILICDYKRGIIIKWNAYMINHIILVTIIHIVLQMIFSICFYQYHWSCVRFLESPCL